MSGVCPLDSDCYVHTNTALTYVRTYKYTLAYTQIRLPYIYIQAQTCVHIYIQVQTYIHILQTCVHILYIHVQTYIHLYTSRLSNQHCDSLRSYIQELAQTVTDC